MSVDSKLILRCQIHPFLYDDTLYIKYNNVKLKRITILAILYNNARFNSLAENNSEKCKEVRAREYCT
jgi:hypothetical protein